MPSIPSVCTALRCATLLGLPFALLACGGSGGGGAGGPGVAQDLASVSPSPMEAAQGSGPGDFAADFLRATHFRSLAVEVDHPVGRAPSAAALQLLTQRLQERCNKPGGISVVVDDAIPTAEFPATVTVQDLERLEADHRDTYSDLSRGIAVFYVLCVTGASNLDGQSTEVLGLSYRGGSLALFMDNANPGPGPFVTRAEIEGAVLVHESGHLLGLVDGGVPMVTPHADPSHPDHDADADCIMYWTISITATGPSLGDADFAQFDARCGEDLAAFGGLATAPTLLPTAKRADAAERYVLGRCGNAVRAEASKRSAP